jgi:hypothetical protein
MNLSYLISTMDLFKKCARHSEQQKKLNTIRGRVGFPGKFATDCMKLDG